MSKKKRTIKKRVRRALPADDVGEGDDPLLWLLKTAVVALLVGRWLVPTEAAAEGDTLWIVQLWLTVGLLWVWHCYREGEFRPRLGWFDLCLWVLIAGHVVSALSVVFGGGQKRAAVNMIWEWVGLGVSFFLIRQLFRTRDDQRRLLLAIVSTAGCLAVLGLWQHFYFYPSMAKAYDLTRNELTALQSEAQPHNRSEAISRQQRIQELSRELADQGAPLEGSSRQLWESRLRASTEPFGLFALANSFAGFLIVGFIVAAGFLIAVWRGTAGVSGRIVPALVVLLILYCLVLTKSRTAWVGLSAGLALWGLLSLRKSAQPASGNWRVWSVAGVVGLVAIVSVAGLSGGIDREVISEAPKSLKYRMQYWHGSWQVLRERPLLGTGPGNFRPHYLKHKLPESSEEIADPHNMLLDIWCSGGLLAVAGLLGLIVVGSTLFHSQAEDDPPNQDNSTDQPSISVASLLREPIFAGLAGGFGMIWSLGWLMGELNSYDYRFSALPMLLVGCLVLVALLERFVPTRPIPNVCLASAVVALLVHLLGAGGIEMPALVQTLLVLPAVAMVATKERTSSDSPKSSLGLLLVGIGLLVLSFCCLITATVPVMQSKPLLVNARFYHLQGNLQQAELFYREAVDHDPLSPQPFSQLAGVMIDQWTVNSKLGSDVFSEAVRIQQMAISLNPYNSRDRETLGRWYRRRFSRTNNIADAREAANYLLQAVERYPTSASLRSELAAGFADAKQLEKAAEEAKMALELDEINHREGHSDRYLSKTTVDRLRKLSPQDGNENSLKTDEKPD